jgi:16S rRNA (cytidine1402-2'-O)-methyltransferase
VGAGATARAGGRLTDACDVPEAGVLTIVATPIGNLGDLSPRAVEALGKADVIACEDIRHSRKLLTHAGVTGPRLIAVHDHNEADQVRTILSLIERGKDVVLISDAGTPGISDPGQRVVAAVASAGHRIEVVPGPSAVVAALVASGLPTHRFCFEGFLPRKGSERTRRLQTISGAGCTTVLYEAPHRLARTLNDLIEVCGPLRQVVLVRELTKLHEEVWRGTLAGAVDHVESMLPRGEYVVVLGSGPPETIDDDTITRALTARIDAGEDKKAAVAAVASSLSVPKRRVYDLALDLASKS